MVIWSAWFIWFLWLNETNRMNETNKTNQMPLLVTPEASLMLSARIRRKISFGEVSVRVS
jgi:hypothetical protein